MADRNDKDIEMRRKLDGHDGLGKDRLQHDLLEAQCSECHRMLPRGELEGGRCRRCVAEGSGTR